MRHKNFSEKANSAHNLLFKTRSFNFKKNMRKVTSVTEKNFNNLNFPILYSTTIYLSSLNKFFLIKKRKYYKKILSIII